MRILGIDYGRKKIGLAIGDTESKLAEPLGIIRYKILEEVLKKLEQVVRTEQAEQVIIGISEGKMADETKEFGKLLKEKFKILVVYQDETLTTLEAQNLSIKAGIRRKKRKELEDAYAATILLQDYLDKLR